MARDVTRRRGGETTPDRPSRLRLWLRRRRALARPAGIALVAGGALFAVGGAIIAFNPTQRIADLVNGVSEIGREAGLTLQEVIVEGRRNTPLELVRAALGVARGDSMLSISPQEVKARLETIAWVERAHVERHLPGTLVVRLTERRAFAIWQREGRFSIIDREGKVVASDGLDAFGPLPLVVGAGADRAAAGMIDLLRSSPDIMARTQALVRVGERRWNLRLHNGTDVMLPEGHEDAAIVRLTELQAQQKLLDRPLAAVDMRLPDRLVLRMPTGPAVGPNDPPGVQRVRSNRG